MGETPPSSRQCHGKAASKQLVSAASAGWGSGPHSEQVSGILSPRYLLSFPFFSHCKSWWESGPAWHTTGPEGQILALLKETKAARGDTWSKFSQLWASAWLWTWTQSHWRIQILAKEALGFEGWLVTALPSLGYFCGSGYPASHSPFISRPGSLGFLWIP